MTLRIYLTLIWNCNFQPIKRKRHPDNKGKRHHMHHMYTVWNSTEPKLLKLSYFSERDIFSRRTIYYVNFGEINKWRFHKEKRKMRRNLTKRHNRAIKHFTSLEHTHSLIVENVVCRHCHSQPAAMMTAIYRQWWTRSHSHPSGIGMVDPMVGADCRVTQRVCVNLPFSFSCFRRCVSLLLLASCTLLLRLALVMHTIWCLVVCHCLCLNVIGRCVWRALCAFSGAVALHWTREACDLNVDIHIIFVEWNRSRSRSSSAHRYLFFSVTCTACNIVQMKWLHPNWTLCSRDWWSHCRFIILCSSRVASRHSIHFLDNKLITSSNWLNANTENWGEYLSKRSCTIKRNGPLHWWGAGDID